MHPSLLPAPQRGLLRAGARTSCSAVTEAPLVGPATVKEAAVRPVTGSVKAMTRGTSCSFVMRPAPPRVAMNTDSSAPLGLRSGSKGNLTEAL